MLSILKPSRSGGFFYEEQPSFLFSENSVPFSIPIPRSSFVVTPGFPLQPGLEIQVFCLPKRLTLLKSMQIDIIRINQLHFFAHLFLNRAEMLQLVICHQSNCSSRFVCTTGSTNSVHIIER